MSTTIADRYVIERSIGIGGMAEVFLATDQLLHRQVAVKILNRAYAEQTEFVERFKREARAAAALDHPNIVPIYDWGKTDDSYYIVMAHVAGETLKEHVRASGPMLEREALELLAGVAGALQTAHDRGIVHRDIKPHNILIDSDNQPRVTDFGIAQAAGLSSLTETSVVLGTATYISPEQASRGQIDARSDIYSLGIVSYEILTGQPPFHGGSIVELAMQHLNETPRRPRAFRPDLSLAAEHLVLKCIEKRPEDRFQSADELHSAIDAALMAPGSFQSEAATVAMAGAAAQHTEETRAARASAVAQPSRPKPKPRPTGPRYVWSGVAIAAFALIGVLALIVSQLGDDSEQDTTAPGDEQSEVVAPDPTDSLDEEQGEIADDEPAQAEPENTGGTEGGAQEQPEEPPAEEPTNDESQQADESAAQSLPGGPGTFTCDGEYSGGSAAALMVPGNATCTLSGARIDDDVTVQPGASLYASGVEIYGDIEASNAAVVVVDGASYVDGNIEHDGGGELRVTDITITGNFQVEDSSGHITAEGNVIDGNLQAEGNRGGLTITSNTINGNLECEGNEPAPTGGGNAVDGDKEDQCADL